MADSIHPRRLEVCSEGDQDTSRRFSRRWWLLGLVLVAAVLWWLPAIVAHSPLLNWAVGMATGDLEGKATIGSASLGWFSAPLLRQIEVRDRQGIAVLVVSEARADQTLSALLSHPSRLGRIELRQPRLELVVDNQSSNVERVLTKYLSRPGESAALEMVLEINEGQIGVRDAVSRESWEIDKLQLTLNMPGAGKSMEVKGSAAMAAQSGLGQLSFEMLLPAAAGQRAAGDDGALGGQVAIQADSIPLGMLRAGASRGLAISRLSGRLSGNIKCVWDAGGLQVQGESGLAELVLAAPKLGSDVLQLQRATFQAEASWKDRQLRVKRAALTSDVGEMQISGDLRLDSTSLAPEVILKSLRQQQYEINGRLDLARLAAILPSTLRIQQQAQIRSGQVRLGLASRPEAQGTLWQAYLEGADLKAVRQGREFQWPQPVVVTLTAREGEQGLAIEQFKCDSNFLVIEAAGTVQSLAASCRFDLNQLTSQIEQLFDLGGLRVAGEGWGHATWKRPTGPGCEAELELQTRNLRLALPGYAPWEEENLVALISASGESDLGSEHCLHGATVRVTTTTDVMEIKLSQPVKSLALDSCYPLEIQMQGRLESWPRRLRNWVALDDWRLAGVFRLASRVSAGSSAVTVEDMRCDLDQLALNGPWLELQEPSMRLALVGKWERAANCVTLRQGTLQSSAMVAQVDDLRLDLAGRDGPGLAAKLKCRGDLARLQAWFGKQGPTPWRLSGAFGGDATLQRVSASTKAEVTAGVDNLVLTHSDGRQFGEPQIRAQLQGEYLPAQGMLDLSQIGLQSQSLSGSGKGRITGLSSQARGELAVDLQYDLDRICHLLRPLIGPAIHFAGQGTAPLRLKGPLDVGRAEGSANVRWTSGYAYGFRLGPATLNAKLAGGRLQLDPLSLDVSEGRLEMTPSVRLFPAPMEVSIAPGPLVKQVRIDPAISDSLLKYVAPAFAGATSAEGKFSVSLDRCRIPADNPERGELQGQLVVHSVQIGPGPLIQELATLMGRVSPAKLTQESTIPFELRDGRIQHRGMELVFSDFTIRTSGSVGLDQTLDLTAEMPVPEKWVGNNVLGTAIRGQTIQLPLAGSLYRPALNRQALDHVSRQFIGNTARNLLEGTLNKQLERLLPTQP